MFDTSLIDDNDHDDDDHIDDDDYDDDDFDDYTSMISEWIDFESTLEVDIESIKKSIKNVEVSMFSE